MMATKIHTPSDTAKVNGPIEPLCDSSSSNPTVSATTFKRVCLVLLSRGSDLDEIQISNIFCTNAGLPLLSTSGNPHYVHGGDYGDERIYYIILDINHAAAPPDVKIQDIPHEVYGVDFKQSRVEP